MKLSFIFIWYNDFMFNRKEAKKAARKNVKSDYVMFVIACLLAAYLGSAYASTLNSFEASSTQAVIETAINGRNENKSITADSVLSQLLQGQINNGENMSDQLMEENTNSGYKIGILELGRTKGVLSGLVNQMNSGKFFVLLFQTILSVTKSKSIATDIFIVVVAMTMFVVSVFIKDTYKVVFRRIFLEGHNYDHVKISRFLFLFRVKKFLKATYTIFLTSIYQFLWDLTIVGGIIKRYSYYMVPYIVAENPDIDANDAIELSIRMMYGHKWECFKLEMSFFGWWVLGACTLGLSQIFFSNPYEECTYCAFYIYLRGLAKENGVSYADKLNDDYLYKKADAKLIKKTYADVVEIMTDDIDVKDLKHNGIRGFIENNFGIIYKYDKEEDLYNIAIEQEEKINEYKSILALEQYPGRLFPIPENKKNPRLEQVHYLRHYSIWSIVAMFFIFCFIGWSWEVSLHLVTDGVFVNRGTMFGPWLPIYGSGGVMILVLLYKFRNRPGLEATLTILLCGTVEYITHWFLEVTRGTKWWDYSGYFLNLNGRICAEGLLVFMLGGMAIVYALGPIIDNRLRRANKKVLVTICSILLILFACDMVYSSKHPNMGEGITDYDEVACEVIRTNKIC